MKDDGKEQTATYLTKRRVPRTVGTGCGIRSERPLPSSARLVAVRRGGAAAAVWPLLTMGCGRLSKHSANDCACNSGRSTPALYSWSRS